MLVESFQGYGGEMKEEEEEKGDLDIANPQQGLV